jgi:2-polyprenyl-3-methyl-5-hydroxy-6-metoxy-1,4-benzoquinol methylase
MALNARTSVIRSLLPKNSERLLDVGCGPITADYPYADKASRVTCVDWNLKASGSVPSNIECLDGDFTSMDLAPGAYDSIVAADVFEHILLEQEPLFVGKCVSALKPGGSMVISVPHQGTFACLDPYQVKPTIHRVLAHLSLYKGIHNGCCDIRKGHKHYTLSELIMKFSPLQISKVSYFGYVFDPLLSWAVALSRGSGRIPGFSWLQRASRKELDRDYGRRSFNIAVSFHKPPVIADHLAGQ